MKADIRLRSASRGFSLIEMLVVVGVLAILAAMAVPAMSSLLPRYQLQSSARSVANLMQEARLYAYNSQKPVRLVLDCQTSPCLAHFASAVYDKNGKLDEAHVNSRGIRSPWEEVTGSRREMASTVNVAPATGSAGVYSGSPDKVYWAVIFPAGRAKASHHPMRLAFTSKAHFLDDYGFQVSLSDISSRVRLQKE